MREMTASRSQIGKKSSLPADFTNLKSLERATNTAYSSAATARTHRSHLTARQTARGCFSSRTALQTRSFPFSRSTMTSRWSTRATQTRALSKSSSRTKALTSRSFSCQKVRFAPTDPTEERYINKKRPDRLDYKKFYRGFAMHFYSDLRPLYNSLKDFIILHLP